MALASQRTAHGRRCEGRSRLDRRRGSCWRRTRLRIESRWRRWWSGQVSKDLQRQRDSIRSRVLRQQDPRLRSNLERPSHLCAGTCGRVAGLRRDPATDSCRAAPRSPAWSGRCPRRSGGKTAARAVVTPSPEPFSNITLSLVEDALAVALTSLGHMASLCRSHDCAQLRSRHRDVDPLLIRALRALFRGAEIELSGKTT